MNRLIVLCLAAAFTVAAGCGDDEQPPEDGERGDRSDFEDLQIQRVSDEFDSFVCVTYDKQDADDASGLWCERDDQPER